LQVGELFKSPKPIKNLKTLKKIKILQLKLEKPVENEKFSENNSGNQNPTFPRNQQIRPCLKLK